MEAYDAIFKRHCVRSYEDRAVPDDVIDRMLKAAVAAANCTVCKIRPRRCRIFFSPRRWRDSRRVGLELSTKAKSREFWGYPPAFVQSS